VLHILIVGVSELLIISTLATAKPRAEPEAEAEADSEYFDTFGTLHKAMWALLWN
jgi:hypothetical protein